MHKILVANRAEIAERIFRTAKRMRFRTVAVYHSADADLPFVKMADEAVYLGDGTLGETYLNAKKIVDIAASVGANFIHPGYGFLSENADFAMMCQRRNIVFVGPQPEIIALMGDKTAARSYAKSLGIPVVCGIEGHVNDIASSVRKEDFPLIVKPVHGGGGKGMKIARSVDELNDALMLAARESKKYFNSEVVFVEHLVLLPRHVEVQVLADKFGNAIHLLDRECTLQRRFQKVVEEAPSSSLSEEQRCNIFMYALQIVKECGYQNAGTVEFLIDSNGKIYFLEMNTRIQVEHPVTEMITKVDIVEQQLLVALGKPLTIKQEEIAPQGHSIELRVIAEDPQNGFMPSAGTIEKLSVPSVVRFDVGYKENNSVTPLFDSLIGKMVIHGVNRREAIQKSIAVVEQSIFLGVKSNLSFLRHLLKSHSYIENKLYTDFIDKSLVGIVAAIGDFKSSIPRHIFVAALMELTVEPTSNSAWRLFHQKTLLLDGKSTDFWATKIVNGWHIKIDGVQKKVHVLKTSEKLFLRMDELEYELLYVAASGHLYLSYKGVDFDVDLQRPNPIDVRPDKNISHYEKQLKSPLNGKVLEIKVAKGQKVVKGTLLLVVESMKMETGIYAPTDAIVGEILVSINQQVSGGAALLHLE